MDGGGGVFWGVCPQACGGVFRGGAGRGRRRAGSGRGSRGRGVWRAGERRRAARGGREGGVVRLVLHRYRSALVDFLYRMVRSREQGEDLAQEVFLRVYRAREDYVPSAKFTTWLFRIATNLALNSVRDNRYQRMEISLDAPVTTDAEDGDEKTMDVAEKHPNIEQHLVEETQRKMIRRAIAKIPEKQRAAVVLHKYQELDYGEISKILGCSESALKSLLFRAYETLRVELAPLVANRKQM